MSINKQFPGLKSTDSSNRHFDITPSNSALLPQITRRIYVTTGGDIALVDLGDNEVVWTVPDNFYIDGQFKQVKETGTDAEGIIGQA